MPEQYSQSFKEENNLPQERSGEAAVVPGLEEHALFARDTVMRWEGDTRVPAHMWYFTNGACCCYCCRSFILAPVCGLEEAI